MILLADGGSTKVDWRLLENGKQISQVTTYGMNPYFRDSKDIMTELLSTLVPALNGLTPESVHFYGAGCTHDAVNKIVRTAICHSLECSQVDVYSDLWGAARGLCGTNAGIACILGTGSNSCLFDGKEILQNVSPLGYILGDEGSGAVLGRLFIGACLKNRLTSGIKEKFLETYELTPAIIIEKVYKQPTPNRFLAGFSPFILAHSEDPSVRTLIKNTFRDFFLNNVMQYEYEKYPVHFAGSVAFHYEQILREVGESLHLRLEQITSSPMEGLISYHTSLIQ